jgi:peptidoglycan-N-acetylglucosamine deacetylase
MYLVKTPQFIQKLFPSFTWNIPTKEKVLYLTFDDGPTSFITPWILDTLEKYNIKATFFCVGKEIKSNTELLKRIISDGHTIGNHTYSHSNGWNGDHIDYFHDVRHCARLLKTNLFRPPYGRLLPKQVQFLERHYKIVMWDVLSGDFDEHVTKEQCYQNVIKNSKPGSIIVFHDNEKAKINMEYALPKVIEHFIALGYEFRNLSHLNEEAKDNNENKTDNIRSIAA